jgi:hypothetical protein
MRTLKQQGRLKMHRKSQPAGSEFRRHLTNVVNLTIKDEALREILFGK